MGQPVAWKVNANQPLMKFLPCEPAELAARLDGEFKASSLSAQQLAQAYVLEIRDTPAIQTPQVLITACTPQGFHHALLALTQLLDSHHGSLTLPALTLADWPELGNRLAKLSGSRNPLKTLQSMAAWLGPMRFNILGIQYHFENREGTYERFMEAMKVMSEQNADGRQELIAYVSPFHPIAGRIPDITQDDGLETYLNLLRRLLELGTSGLVIDYNDFGADEGERMARTLSHIHRQLKCRYPQARFFLCPPLHGEAKYFGPASEQLAEILRAIPVDFHVFWTGMKVNPTVFAREELEAWSAVTGRRPFLWLNAIGHQIGNDPRDRNAEARRLPRHNLIGQPEAWVFNHQMLPQRFADLIDGVHLNITFSTTTTDEQRWQYHELPEVMPSAGIRYLATVADYLWNPHDWDGEDAYHRATRFSDLFAPLLNQTLAP
jgi:hypothetical protein